MSAEAPNLRKARNKIEQAESEFERLNPRTRIELAAVQRIREHLRDAIAAIGPLPEVSPIEWPKSEPGHSLDSRRK